MEETSLVIVVEHLPPFRNQLRTQHYTVDQVHLEVVLTHCHKEWERLCAAWRPGYVAVIEVPTGELEIAVKEVLPKVRAIVAERDIRWFDMPARVRRFDAVRVCYATTRDGRGWKRLSRALLPQ